MEAGVEAGVESGMQCGVERGDDARVPMRRLPMTAVCDAPGPDGVAGQDPDAMSLEIRLVGRFAIRCAGEDRRMPPSRKLRALVAYLALAGRDVSRERLGELFWDQADDPRGELRWALSKLRGVLDGPPPLRATPGVSIVRVAGESVQFDLRGVRVDALHVATAVRSGLDRCPIEALRALDRLADDDLLPGLALDGCAAWDGWLVAQRRRHRATRVALLQALSDRLPEGGDERLAVVERWLALVPFDGQAHERLLGTLASAGRWVEGDEHVAQTVRRYDAERLDAASLVAAWRRLRETPGRGVVGVVTPPVDPESRMRVDGACTPTPRRARLAVMPFLAEGPGEGSRLADGVVVDVITRLARLRSLFVIAAASVFAIGHGARGRIAGGEAAGRALGVDFVVAGTWRSAGGRLVLSVQLVETQGARVIWAERLELPAADPFTAMDTLVDRIVASISQQVEQAEMQRAIVKPPGALDAWEWFHRGLWHMMRFDRASNDQARRCFAEAVRLDPGFSRPYAGLSFTHFQDALLGWADRDGAVEQAYRSASDGLMADEIDPSAHWALGRAQWLRRRPVEAMAEIDTALELSPNFAHAHYTRGFFHCQLGDPHAAVAASDQARALSPYDPLMFAICGSRALALLRLGRADEAADWSLKAIARPNAHVHIQCIALLSLSMAGRVDEARALAARARLAHASYRYADFEAAFHFGDTMQARMRRAASAVGLD